MTKYKYLMKYTFDKNWSRISKSEYDHAKSLGSALQAMCIEIKKEEMTHIDKEIIKAAKRKIKEIVKECKEKGIDPQSEFDCNQEEV